MLFCHGEVYGSLLSRNLMDLKRGDDIFHWCIEKLARIDRVVTSFQIYSNFPPFFFIRNLECLILIDSLLFLRITEALMNLKLFLFQAK